MTDPAYLLGLRLGGRRVLTVGGGSVAQRRVPKLLEAGADVVVVAPEVSPALDDLAARGRLSLRRRPYRSGDCAEAWLVQACTDDPAVNAAVAAEAEQRRIWCVRADDRDASPAWTPATGRAADVTVGVLTDRDPPRAAGLRDAVVEGVHTGRLPAVSRRPSGGGVALVGGGPGEAGLITLRGRQLLAQADVVIADRLAPRELLDELRPDVEVVDAAKIPYGRSAIQQNINRLLVDRARTGWFVVRLKGGDAFTFGRGAEEMLACADAGVPVEVVPGVTSATAAPAAAGVPVTHRGLTQQFHVVSAHAPPGDPRSTVDWPALGRSGGTLVVLMAVEHIQAIADALMQHGRAPATPACVVQDAKLTTQRVLTATLATVADEAAGQIHPPAVVVIGDVVNVARETGVLRSTRGGPATP